MAALPAQFSDLEPFAAWCLEFERERYAKRLGSSMADMQAFYDAALPRVPDALTYCDGFPLDDMPDDAVHLLQLVYSFIVVSFAVELWHQRYVPDTRGTSFDRISEPLP